MLVYFALRQGNAHLRSRGVTGFFVPEALSVVILSTFFSWARETKKIADSAAVAAVAADAVTVATAADVDVATAATVAADATAAAVAIAPDAAAAFCNPYTCRNPSNP